MIPQIVAAKSAWSTFVGIASNRLVQISILSALLALSWARGNHYQESRDLWRTASQHQELAYTAAQVAAKAAQDAQRAKQNADYQEAKDNADKQAQALRGDYQRKLDDYISRMRAKGDGCSSSGPAAAYQDQIAGSVEAANDKAGMVSVSEHDLSLMVQAVADIETARAWAADLIKKDLAQ